MSIEHKQFDIAVVGKGVAKGTTLEDCWSVVEASSKYQEWVSFFTRTDVLAPGKDSPDGIGSLRKFYNKEGRGILEIVNIHHKPYVYGYRVVDADSGLKDHQGVVTLREVPGGTEIIWCMTANNDGLFSLESGDVFAPAPAQAQAAMQGVIDITVTDLVGACEAKARG